ncbi:PREDICTED: uncharacterized protein LOC108765728 [Trachymyrmex cornetzi]|uniref:uncharacterized protein LOC108765728 n=1 Tax=Trachymyrmex cornetzi TaxID=471704 RepID=UPI00084F82FC|nr:PREDICTED: uncharacterized protein LOC108765728 [Trachymyrmex cornetzi]
MIADLEEEMGKVKWGVVKVAGEIVYGLAYADDIVLLAEDEGSMRSLLEKLEGYVDRKGLELNIDKIKNNERNGGQEEHVKERVARAMVVMGQVWWIGKRRFEKDWKRRVWLFDKLIWAMVSYGVEIWGWKEREAVESLQERYLRWVLGVERTPGYLVREELQRE